MSLWQRLRDLPRVLSGEGGRLRLVYLAYFGAYGTMLPFLARYLVGSGFTGRQVGVVQMIPSVVALFGGIVWARIAEKRRDTVRVIGWMTAWAATCALFLPFATTPVTVGLVLLGMSLGDRGLVPLLDSLSVEWARSRPGRSYSHIRTFGSVGFAALAFLLGQALTRRGDQPADPIIPATIAGFAVAYAVAARRLVPHTVTHAEHASWRDLLVLLGNGRLMLLLLACAIHWMACMPYSLWMGQLVEELHLPATVTGSGITAGVVAEVGIMSVYPWFERRLSPRALLAVAFAGSAIRWGLLARTTDPTAVVALQLLHGLSYGLFWLTLVKLVTALVPARMRATGLALCSATVFGLGNMVGSLVAGWAHDRTHSVARLFGWGAWVEAGLAAAVIALLARQAARGAAASGGGAPA